MNMALPAVLGRTPADDKVGDERVREVVGALDVRTGIEPVQRVSDELVDAGGGVVAVGKRKRGVQLAREAHAASSRIRPTTALRSSRPMFISSTRRLTIASHSRGASCSAIESSNVSSPKRSGCASHADLIWSAV